jgi:hypothetical protein
MQVKSLLLSIRKLDDRIEFHGLIVLVPTQHESGFSIGAARNHMNP